MTFMVSIYGDIVVRGGVGGSLGIRRNCCE